MIRNLKVLLAAAVALTALGVLGASSAQAVTEFHCDVAPCRLTLKPDGTGKTTHHVFVVKDSTGASVAFTCNEITGHATPPGTTSTEITVTGIEYHVCSASVGGKTKVRMNECDYDFTSHGELRVKITCPAGKKIEVEIEATGCIATVGESKAELKHVTYHNIGVQASNTTEITVEPIVTNIEVTMDGNKEKCGIDPTKTPVTSEYTTGNTLVTAETHAGVMANAWWA